MENGSRKSPLRTPYPETSGVSWLTPRRPPLQEGHHVASVMRDVMGGRDAGEDLERDRVSNSYSVCGLIYLSVRC